MKKKAFLQFCVAICLAVLLQGCAAAWQEMGETGEVPETTKNRANALLSAYCGFPLLGNLNTVLTGFAQAIYPAWVSTCETYRQQAAEE